MLVLRQIDPVGVRERFIINFLSIAIVLHFSLHVYYYNITQGPNYAWHVDQYKLSTFGFFFIHGCIDG